MGEIENILKIHDKISEKRDEEIGAYLNKEEKKYTIRGIYKGEAIIWHVDRSFLKGKGYKEIERVLFPYFKIKFKTKYKDFNEKKLEIGYFKDNLRVSYKTFIKDI